MTRMANDVERRTCERPNIRKAHLDSTADHSRQSKAHSCDAIRPSARAFSRLVFYIFSGTLMSRGDPSPRCKNARAVKFAERQSRASQPVPPISEPDRLRKRRGSCWPARRDNSPECWDENHSTPSARSRQTDTVVAPDFVLPVRPSASSVRRSTNTPSAPLSGRSIECGHRRFADRAPCSPETTSISVPGKNVIRHPILGEIGVLDRADPDHFARSRFSPLPAGPDSFRPRSCAARAIASSSTSRSATFSPDRVFISFRSSPRMLPNVMWRKSAV